MQTNEREIIIEHALDLEDKENLEIVLDITSPHTDLVNRIAALLKDQNDFVEVNILHWHSLAPWLRKEIIETVVTNSSDGTFEQNDNANKGEIIIEHALKNEENLEMTLDIIFAGYELRGRIIDDFLEKLQVFIKKELDMSRWDFQEYWDVTSKSLPKVKIGICRNPHRDNKQFIGIHVGSLKPLSPKWYRLKSKLEAKLKEGYDRKNQHWIWKTRDWEYKDWTDKDTLIKMHTETNCVVKEIGEYFLKICGEAELVIDKWVKENAHNG